MSAPVNPIDPALLRGLTSRRMGRRNILKAAGIGVAGTALAACSVKGQAVGTKSVAPDAVAKFWAGKTGSGHVNFANWPLYMDSDHPQLKEFTSKTGVTVTYSEVINDDPSFFAKIQPKLAAHQSIGYDLMVITNGSEFSELIEFGYYAPLDHSKMPNFSQYAGANYKTEAFDPGNVYSVPWASGLTGIAYNPKYVKTAPTGMQDLMNAAYHGKIGMFADAEEIGVFAMLAVGVNPEKSTPDDWQKAATWLKQQQSAGLVRKYYDQDYIADLNNGDIWLTMAWSGDIFQSNASNGTDLKFVVPSEGGTLWTDNMTIPVTADNPVDALTLIDFFYDPKVAASLAEYINYIPPVPSAQAIIQSDADAAKGDDKTALEQVATSSLVFPSAADLAKLHYYRAFKNADERAAYHAVFDPITTS
jgi:spermidine/putrescine transport system substrate-binding protein